MNSYTDEIEEKSAKPGPEIPTHLARTASSLDSSPTGKRVLTTAVLLAVA